MRKLIFGIISVALLQAGYIAYINSVKLLNADTVRLASEQRAKPYRVPVPADEWPVTHDRMSDNVVDANQRSTTPESLNNRATSVAKHRIQAPQTIARRRIYVRSTPSIKQIPVPVGERISSDDVYASRKTSGVKEKTRSENKSLVAAALPIIKKPYDWLKAIGSKLR